jgi:polyisoprenoid-binding protein YceI
LLATSKRGGIVSDPTSDPSATGPTGDPSATGPTGRPPATTGGAAPALPTGRWALDPDNSRAEFAVKHFWGLTTVRGHFNSVAGELSIDPAGAAAGELRIDAATVDTGNARRDKHLRSADFFGADEHPHVVFTPSAVRRVDDSALEMQGRLAIAGHDEPLTLRVDAPHAAPDLTLRATTVVDRRKFGMTWRPLGISHNDATLTVDARLTPAAT